MYQSHQSWDHPEHHQTWGWGNNERYPSTEQSWYQDNPNYQTSTTSKHRRAGWSSMPFSTLPGLYRALNSDLIPETEYSSLRNASSEILSKCTDNDSSVHVYHITGSKDELLLVHAVIQRLLSEEQKESSPTLVVVAEDLKNASTDPARDVRDLLKLATGKGELKLSESVYSYEQVVLIVNKAGRPPSGHHLKNPQSEAFQTWRSAQKTAMDSVTSAILGIKQTTGREKVVWHDGAYLPMLMYMLECESRYSQVKYTAVTINGVYELTDKHVAPINSTVSEQINFITASAKKLNCPIVLIHSSVLGLKNLKWLYHMPTLSSVWPILLPASSWNEDIKHMLNGITTSVFRLRASLYGYTGSRVSALAMAELNKVRETSKQWAKEVLLPSSYTPDVCAGDDALRKMHFTNKLCDMPLMESCTNLFTLLVSARGPRSEVHAVRCALSNDNKALALSANGIVYILKPGKNGHKALEASFLRYWGNFLAARGRRGDVPSVPRGLALAWRDLVGVLEGQIKAMKSDQRTRRWSTDDKKAVEEALGALREGGMTRLCKRALSS
ncbi:hypothetical protein EJ05DRAFT_488285 [Pseudovirgaria hyperparasitica]|uniref:Uncharacterized protein n=1 Tax=Pseudovirgaria hyperparasitica TaxID=470096 RepID=A0A6A6W0M2_9PEZI|nr:uncharacterized protein EJ05DRAFT_488285 [Pseudovirgaria hyperparasitica]KAF2755534.1 hypothetical protein EJ05DRAFT_488285 [Pseudovirgaria hyperparasitica]